VKQALEAIAKITDIDIEQAAAMCRRHPLFDEEIHIEEELINLEEAVKAYTVAIESKALKHYPHLRRHLLVDCRLTLVHTIGLVVRMLRKQDLPRKYSEDDIKFAIHKIVRLVIADARRTNRRLNDEIINATRPFMSLKQQLIFRQEHSLNPLGYIRILQRLMITA
jgi:hypothetical protein